MSNLSLIIDFTYQFFGVLVRTLNLSNLLRKSPKLRRDDSVDVIDLSFSPEIGLIGNGVLKTASLVLTVEIVFGAAVKLVDWLAGENPPDGGLPNIFNGLRLLRELEAEVLKVDAPGFKAKVLENDVPGFEEWFCISGVMLNADDFGKLSDD